MKSLLLPSMIIATMEGQEEIQNKQTKATQKYLDRFSLWILALEIIFLNNLINSQFFHYEFSPGYTESIM